jgi:hypothetical protein
MVDQQPSAATGATAAATGSTTTGSATGSTAAAPESTAASSDWYVSGGVNWPGYTLPQLVSMVAQQASVPQLQQLAIDWRSAGDGIADTADYLAEALDDLMNYWTGASAEAARHTVALNAQWVSDLGITAREMGGPIEEAAGALKAAQDAMPQMPQVAPVPETSSAPMNAQQAQALTGSPLAAAVAASAAGSRSAFAGQAEDTAAKRVAVETMQRFENAAVGIDRATPRFLGQNSKLVPRDDLVVDPGDGDFAHKVTTTTGLDMRWKFLTNLPLGATTAQLASGAGIDGSTFGLINGSITGVGGIGGGVGGTTFGPLNGDFSTFGGLNGGGLGNSGFGVGGLGGSGLGGSGGEGVDRFGNAIPTRGGLPTSSSGVIGGANSTHAVGGPMGATPMGAGAMGAAAATGAHRRRVPFDADDPFDTGQKASPPVIGL